MTRALLGIAGLRVRYGMIEAVADVSFDVPQGAIVSLIGSNGAGKTSTLKAVAGLIPAAAGTVTLRGQDLGTRPAHARVALGLSLVPEGRRVFARLTVAENLLLGAYLRPGDPEVAADMAEIIGLLPVLGERRRQLAGTLSGGEQQMLAIGRAMMSRPQMLLMDEPTMGLSPRMVEAVLEKIAEINRRGTTILLVEQNAIDAIALSSMVHVLRRGRIVHSGPGSELGADRLRELYLGTDGTTMDTT